MKSLFRLVGRYDRVLMYGAWFWALAGLLSDRRYEEFLRPEFGVLLAFGLLAVIAFFLVEAGRLGRNPRSGLAGALPWTVLAAPLLYLPITRGVVLDAAAFDKRWTGLDGYDSTGELQLLAPGGLSAMTGDRSVTMDGLDWNGLNDIDIAGDASLVELAELATSNGVRHVTLADLCWEAERYHGREIVVEGMIKHVPGIADQFGSEACLLYRFVVSCCVADAMPAAILLVGELPPLSKDDTWIKAEGVFKLETQDGRDVIRLDLDRATPITPPRNPYLY